MNITLVVLLAAAALVFFLVKGKKKDSWKTASGIVGVYALLALFLVPNIAIPDYLAGVQGQAVAPVGGTNPPNTVGGQVIVTTNPTIAVSAFNAQASGTSVGTSLVYQFNGAGGFVSTPATAVPGQTLEIIITNGTYGTTSTATYHAAHVPVFTVGTGSFPVSVPMNKNATVTENVYSTTGIVMTNGAGGASNQTALGVGATYNFKDEMTPSALTKTQDMTCIIEINYGVNASITPQGAILSLAGSPLPLKSTSAPAYYTTVGTNSRVWVYDVPSLQGGATATFNVNINTASTKDLPAGTEILKHCYTKEWFVDPNTALATFDVADSNGLLKSINTYGYDWFFQ